MKALKNTIRDVRTFISFLLIFPPEELAGKNSELFKPHNKRFHHDKNYHQR